MAEPGEFTKRAFLNGRVDLTQAEAVMDIIRAKTDKAMNNAVKQLDGSLSNLINNTRQEILNTLAQVEVNIDYPEYDDVEEATTEIIREKTLEFEQLLTHLLKTARLSQDSSHLILLLVGCFSKLLDEARFCAKGFLLLSSVDLMLANPASSTIFCVRTRPL